MRDILFSYVQMPDLQNILLGVSAVAPWGGVFGTLSFQWRWLDSCRENICFEYINLEICSWSMVGGGSIYPVDCRSKKAASEHWREVVGSLAALGFISELFRPSRSDSLLLIGLIRETNLLHLSLVWWQRHLCRALRGTRQIWFGSGVGCLLYPRMRRVLLVRWWPCPG